MKVLVLGYSGTMGQRIVRLLREHITGVTLLGACRTADDESIIETRVIDYNNALSLASGLRDVDFLIHAAGPFNHKPDLLIDACLRQGIHYIDIAESLSFIQNVGALVASHKNYRTAVVSGCSTVPGLVTCLAQKFDQLDNLTEIEVSLNMGSSNPVTLGLCFSLLRPLGVKSPTGEKWFRQFKSITHLDKKTRYYGNYPIPIAGGIKVSDKHVPVNFVMGFDRRYVNFLLYVASLLTSKLSASQLIFFCKCIMPFAGIAKLFGGAAGHLTLIAKDGRGNTLSQLELIAEKDGLDIPAITAVWAVQSLLAVSNSEASECFTKVGFLGLENLLGADAVINKLKAMGHIVLEKKGD